MLRNNAPEGVMKNTQTVNGMESCIKCKMKGFFCYTPDGADFNTCPCCGKDDHVNSISAKRDKYYFLYEDEYCDDMRCPRKFNYCEFCKIMFKVGCVHNVLGCTDNVYNDHFIQSWRDKTTGIDYVGMPQFEDTDDWFENANNVEVLRMYCPHKAAVCSRQRNPTVAHCHV